MGRPCDEYPGGLEVVSMGGGDGAFPGISLEPLLHHNIGRLARLRQPSFLAFSAAVLDLGRPAGADVALVMSNPGVGDCVSNQCDAAMLTRACSKSMVARFGILKPDKGPDAIQVYDPVLPVLPVWCSPACQAWGAVHVCRDANLVQRHSASALTNQGKVWLLMVAGLEG